jgi:DNA polymerase elongation subunit (family B)
MTKSNEPKILFIDIETSPIVAYTWGPKWETNIIEFIDQSQILSFSAKWFGGKQITKGLIDYKNYKQNTINDVEIVKEIHSLLDEADVVVTQNGVSFDHKVINARLIKHGLMPPSPYKMVDTKVEAKRYLRLPSYALDDMGKYFDVGQKLSHEGFGLWKKCMEGDKASWNLMKKYNAQDVLLTEKVYLKIRPFMRTHPNFSTYNDKNNCPKCGSNKVQSRGYSVNTTAMFQRAQCMNCGGWFRFGKRVLNINNTVRNI